MKRLGLAYVAVGGMGMILIGAYLGLLFLSGDPLLTKTVFSAKAGQPSKTALEGRRDVTRYRPIRTSLSPDMNPIALFVLLRMAKGGSSSATAEYTLDVQTAAGQPVASAKVRARRGKSGGATGRRVGRSAAKSSILHGMSLEVPETADYIVRVGPGKRQGLPITHLELRLRRNATRPPIGLLLGGIAAMFLGILGGMATAVRRVVKQWAES